MLMLPCRWFLSDHSPKELNAISGQKLKTILKNKDVSPFVLGAFKDWGCFSQVTLSLCLPGVIRAGDPSAGQLEDSLDYLFLYKPTKRLSLPYDGMDGLNKVAM